MWLREDVNVKRGKLGKSEEDNVTLVRGSGLMTKSTKRHTEFLQLKAP